MLRPLWNTAGHEGDIFAVGFLPNSPCLVSGGMDYSIRLWDPLHGEALWSVDGNEHFALSPDGTMLAHVGRDGTLLLSDTATGAVLHDIAVESVQWNIDPNRKAPLVPVAFSPEGSLLAMGAKRSLVLFDLISKTVQRELPTDNVFGVSKAAFSRNGNIVAASNALDIQLWYVATGTRCQTLNASDIDSMAFSPSGELMATCDGWAQDEQSVQSWSIATGRQISTMPDSGAIVSVVFSPDGSLLAGSGWRTADQTPRNSGTPDNPEAAEGRGIVQIWRVADGVLLQTVEADTDTIWSLAFASDGTLLATGSGRGTVQVWAVEQPH